MSPRQLIHRLVNQGKQAPVTPPCSAPGRSQRGSGERLRLCWNSQTKASHRWSATAARRGCHLHFNPVVDLTARPHRPVSPGRFDRPRKQASPYQRIHCATRKPCSSKDLVERKQRLLDTGHCGSSSATGHRHSTLLDFPPNPSMKQPAPAHPGATPGPSIPGSSSCKRQHSLVPNTETNNDQHHRQPARRPARRRTQCKPGGVASSAYPTS